LSPFRSRSMSGQQLTWRGPQGSLQPLDAARAATARADIAASAREAGLERLADWLDADSAPVRFLAAAAELSPWLGDTMRRMPQMLDALFDQAPGERLKALEGEIAALGRDAELSEAQLMD